MEAHRTGWNQHQKALRQALGHSEGHRESLDLFLGQHAMVHAAEMSQAGLWSFQDEVLEGVSPQGLRLIPPAGEHSIAWILWHITRIEDVTMNLLAAGSPQVLLEEDWLKRMEVSIQDTGNAMPAERVAGLSADINLDALLSYRLAVGRRTRIIVSQLQPEQLKKKVDPIRLEQITREGAVLPTAPEVLAYWGGLTLAGLLLMPPTRHPFLHWNEALRIKKRIRGKT